MKTRHDVEPQEARRPPRLRCALTRRLDIAQQRVRLLDTPGSRKKCARALGWTLSMVFGRACIDAGVPKIRLHDAPHTNASLLLLEQGTDVAAVSERLGHSRVAVTMSLYAHAIAGRQKVAAESFGRMLAGRDVKACGVDSPNASGVRIR